MWRPEYFVRYVSLPSCVEGVTLPNDDGSFDVYINSDLPEPVRERVLRHELSHLMEDHFYREELPIAQAEALASAAGRGQRLVGLPVVTAEESAGRVRISVPETPRPRTIRVFYSLEALKRFAAAGGFLN